MVAQFIQSDEGQLRASKDAIFKVLLQRWGVLTSQKDLQIAVALRNLPIRPLTSCNSPKNAPDRKALL